MRSSQSGRNRQPASVTAMISCCALRIARFLPLAMLDRCSIQRMFKPLKLRIREVVLSVEPPSTITTSSGTILWHAIDLRKSPMDCPRSLRL